MASRQRSTGAWLVLIGWLSFTGVAFLRGLRNLPADASDVLASWNGVSTPAALVLFALVAIGSLLLHPLDALLRQQGFRDAKRRGFNTRIQLLDQPASGLLTVLSVRSAIGAGMIAAIWSNRATLLKDLPSTAIHWSDLANAPLWSTPRLLIFYAVTLVLLTSVMTTLVSLLCYDYSLRFDWEAAGKNGVKIELRKKGHDIGVIGFYCLMWTFPAGTFLFDPLLSIIVCSGVVVLLWHYYYFSSRVFEGPGVSETKSENVSRTEATLKGTVKPWTQKRSAHFEYGRTTAYGSITEDVVICNGSTDTPITATITGLSPNTRYHARLVAGMDIGADHAFDTAGDAHH